MKQDKKINIYLFWVIYLSVIPVSIYATSIPIQIVEGQASLKHIQHRLLNDSSYMLSQVEPVKSLEKDTFDNKSLDTTATDEQFNDEDTDTDSEDDENDEDDEDSDFNYTEEEDFDENLSEDTTVDLLYKDETVFEDEDKDEDEDSDFLYEDEKDLDDEDSEDSEDSEVDEDDKLSDLKEITNDELVEENTTQDTNQNIKNTQSI